MKRLNPSGHHQPSRIALSRRQLLGGLAGLAAASSTAQAALLFRPSQLNHLTLNVSDLERSRAFYRKLFGGPQWTVSPAALDSFDLGANPLGLYLNSRGTPVGIDHFCIGLQDFNGDTALSTLKQQSMDAQKAANGGIEFRDLDGIKVELVPENYRNRGAEPAKGPQPPVQSLFRPVGLNHVTLQVANLERSTKFYESLFGPPFGIQRAQNTSFRLAAPNERQVGGTHEGGHSAWGTPRPSVDRRAHRADFIRDPRRCPALYVVLAASAFVARPSLTALLDQEPHDRE
jgi:catechol 2,3-dioxygenase-like lactoylglutathione lyase family enzyme